MKRNLIIKYQKRLTTKIRFIINNPAFTSIYSIIIIVTTIMNFKSKKKIFFYLNDKNTLNKLSLLKTNIIRPNKYKEIQSTYSPKHFPVSSREWNNSIYAYNKNALNLIPVASISATKLIKSYFSLMNLNLEKKLRTRKLPRRFRRLSKNRIFLGNNEFKHTNNKVMVNLYLFNRQEKNFLIILKKRYNNWKKRNRFQRKNKFSGKNIFWKNHNQYFFMRLMYLKRKFYLFTKEHEINKYNLIRLKQLSGDSLKESLNKLEYSIIKFKSEIREKSLEKLQLYFYYRQLIYMNKSKFNYTYLQYLKEYLYIVFNKNVEFNLINLKRFYLNSEILSESIKLKLTKNRRRIFRHLSELKNKVKIKKKNVVLSKSVSSNNIDHNNLIKTYIQKNIIESIKHKNVTGFRLEAKGRLTRRHTASRSVTKVKYKGNLLNMDSSHRGLSTVLLKGNLESNLQYTKLRSKTNIGSFGIKGWVNGN